MPDATTDPNTPKPQGSGDTGGTDRKLWAEKYETPEAMEKGYLELQKGFHDTRQEMREVKELLTQRLPEPRTTQDGYGTQDRASYGDVNAQVLQAFYTNPAQVLVEVKEAAKKELKAEFAESRKRTQSEAQVVERWKAENLDILAKPVYQKLFAAEVASTDPKLPTETRLNTAAKVVRQQILELRGHQERTPNSTDHREGPSGGEYGYSAGGGGHEPVPNDPEAAFKQALKERVALYKPKKPGQA